MRIDLYVGPSLRGEQLTRLVAEVPATVRVLPPARQGDVIRTFDDPPDVIALLDGVFFQSPALYHKELLASLDLGVRVIGACSMGALRAAELDQFGMEGVGRVYQLYRRGTIDGDDMVALAHGSAADDYRPISVPLVNIRHNVLAATRRNAVTRRSALAVLAAANSLFFPERTWDAVIVAARHHGVTEAELERLRVDLAAHEVDLKYEDAVQLLKLLARRARNRNWPAPERVGTHRTTYFEKLIQDHAGCQVGDRYVVTSTAINLRRLLDNDFIEVQRHVAQRCLAADQAEVSGLEPRSASELLEEFGPWRDAGSEQARAAWLSDHRMDRDELIRSLSERDLQARLYNLLVETGNDPVAAVATAVRRRTGMRTGALSGRLLAHPGVAWDAPLLREIKMRGEWPDTLALARQVADLSDAFDRKHPGVRARLSDDGLGEWFAGRWNVSADTLGAAVRERFFNGNADFLETARLGYVYDWMRSKQKKGVPEPIGTS